MILLPQYHMDRRSRTRYCEPDSTYLAGSFTTRQILQYPSSSDFLEITVYPQETIALVYASPYPQHLLKCRNYLMHVSFSE